MTTDYYSNNTNVVKSSCQEKRIRRDLWLSRIWMLLNYMKRLVSSNYLIDSITI